MFEIILYLCNNKYLYKSLILSTYKQYMNAYKQTCDNYTEYKKYQNKEENILFKENYMKSSNKQYEILSELVSLLKLYYKKYPNSNIKNYRLLETYDIYPYKLTQNLPELIKFVSES